LDLKQLEYFVRVAELGSFTRASIVFNIAQPALSRQVRLLEVELHQNLLIRNGRGVTVTEAGQVLLEHGRGILHQVERAKEELSRVRGALVGRVVLGMPPSLLRGLAVPLMREFRARLPNASLSISEGLSVTMHEALASGRLDVALLYNIVPSQDVETFPLLEEELFLVAGKQEDETALPISLRDVADIPLVIPSRPHSIRMLVESELANLGCRPKIALEIDGVSAILELVADGEGSAILTRNAIASSGKAETFSMRPIVKPALRSRLAMAASLRHPATLTQQLLMDIIRDNIDKWLST
jgi:LysR family nitrogen assimilation transcriptional regulator